MEQKIHQHSHMHNNIFKPDSVVFIKVTDETWKEEYDLEALQARHLGKNLYLIISIPHTIYNIQRYDLVEVEVETMIVTKLIHRGRNTSIRIIFNQDDEQSSVLDDLVKMDYSLDPYNFNMVAVDLDVENSREILANEMRKLMDNKKIKDWEYVVQE